VASLYVQAIKPVPTKGGEAEASAIEDVASTPTGFCSTTLDGSSASGILQYNTHQYLSKL
jgi:hypothetical protein